MTQYILLIQGNTKSKATEQEWQEFFTAAEESDVFRGGSEIGERVCAGDAGSMQSTDHVVGYMRFDCDDRQQILALLERHPAVMHGGSVELCALPES